MTASAFHWGALCPSRSKIAASNDNAQLTKRSWNKLLNKTGGTFNAVTEHVRATEAGRLAGEYADLRHAVVDFKWRKLIAMIGAPSAGLWPPPTQLWLMSPGPAFEEAFSEMYSH